MSLQSLLFGYSGEFGCLESVDPELTAKYNCDNGPVLMVMEAAEMLHDIYMEAFYDTNDIEISAAMEGMTVLTEASSKGSTFKEKIKNAWGKLKDLFRRFVEWLKGILGSVWGFIKDHCKKAKDFIVGIPSNIKSRLSKLEYEGFKYTNVDDYSKFAAKVGISSTNFKKLGDKLGKIAADVSKGKYGGGSEEGAEPYKENDVDTAMEKELKSSLLDVKKIFGIGENTTSDEASKLLFAYFRNGAKDAEAKSKQTVSVHDAEAAVNDTEKMLATINKLFTGLQADYEYQAKLCAANEERLNSQGIEDVRILSSLVNSQRKIATYSNQMNTFVSTVTNAWKNAVTERNSEYTKALAKAAAEAKKEEGSN